MIMRAVKIFLITVTLLHLSVAGEPKRPFSIVFRSIAVDTAAGIAPAQRNSVSGFTDRQTKALVYSLAVPGSGQTFLGETYKGVGITLTAFGSLITSIISHNNFIARNERLDALEFQYSVSPTWVASEYIYDEMRSAHRQLQQDKDRRDLFIVITAVVWSLNIVDVLYNTEDHGEALFSLHSQRNPSVGITGLDTPHTPLMTLSLPLH
jgi:hypothetical protein